MGRTARRHVIRLGRPASPWSRLRAVAAAPVCAQLERSCTLTNEITALAPSTETDAAIDRDRFDDAYARATAALKEAALGDAEAALHEAAAACLHSRLDFGRRELLITALHTLNTLSIRMGVGQDWMRRLRGRDLPLIVMASLPRTGSTAVWQMADDLRPSAVFKLHQFPLLANPALITVRDPRDVLLSNVVLSLRRTTTNPAAKLKSLNPLQLDPAVKRIQKSGALLRNAMDRIYGPLGNASVLFYEIEVCDLARGAGKVAQALGQSLSVEDAAALASKFSRDHNKALAQDFGDFSQYSVRTYIHGHHDFDGEPGAWAHHFGPQVHGYITCSFADDLRYWGYQP